MGTAHVIVTRAIRDRLRSYFAAQVRILYEEPWPDPARVWLKVRSEALGPGDHGLVEITITGKQITSPALMTSSSSRAAPPDAECTALTKVKAQLTDGTTMTALTPGQWNFVRGFYMGAPPTLQGKIPGIRAVLLERKGDKGP